MKFVSVIIPVRNNANGIRILLESLANQTYPKNCYEIIVIDNGSDDNTMLVAHEYLRLYPDLIQVLAENSIRSSYAARNKGISESQGEIIAMIDSDCIPVPEWIENGVKTIINEDADLIGGKVTFTFSPKKTAAEIFDSISNMQIEAYIENRRVAITANLFTYREVFETIGYFPSHLTSGGDVLWTGKATDYGFKLVYSPDAEIHHPARKFNELMKKKFRIGRVQPIIWNEQENSWYYTFTRLLLDFLPNYTVRMIANVLTSHGLNKKILIISVWVVSWLSRIATNLGRFHYLVCQLNPGLKSKQKITNL